jgi:hypothetical protein
MLHASRPHEYAEDAFLAWLDGACGGYAALREKADDFVPVPDPERPDRRVPPAPARRG